MGDLPPVLAQPEECGFIASTQTCRVGRVASARANAAAAAGAAGLVIRYRRASSEGDAARPPQLWYTIHAWTGQIIRPTGRHQQDTLAGPRGRPRDGPRT